MDYISMILFAVLFTMEVVLGILFFTEKNRSKRRQSALLDYIDRLNESTIAALNGETSDIINEYNERIEKQLIKSTDDKFTEFKETVLRNVKDALSVHDEKLKGELALDYQEAQAAANKINDFSSSLAAIFDYDPVKAIQRGRKKEAS